MIVRTWQVEHGYIYKVVEHGEVHYELYDRNGKFIESGDRLHDLEAAYCLTF